MPPPTATWKSIERFIPKYLDPEEGERTHWALEDGRALCYAIEAKHGKQIPKTILKWWDQTVRNAGDRRPLLVLHPPRWRMEESLAIIPLHELRRLLHGNDQEQRERGTEDDQ